MVENNEFNTQGKTKYCQNRITCYSNL